MILNLYFSLAAERLEAIEAATMTNEVMLREVSSKLDIVIMNLGRMQRTIAPNERRISKPHGMPKIPLETRQQLNKFETFLGASDENLAAVVSVK